MSSFRLKIKVKDVEDEALFVLFDDVVEKFAPNACDLMIGMVRMGLYLFFVF